MTINKKSLANLKPFMPDDPVTGAKDKRIHRGGKPKTFAQLRKLAQAIAAEPLSDSEKLTRIEALLRLMSSSRAPADRKTFLEYAFGKVKDEVDVNNSGDVILRVIREEAKKTDAT
ncbi:MAG: hypothetical protein ABII09_12505 [Planctomycetota bacterium]